MSQSLTPNRTRSARRAVAALVLGATLAVLATSAFAGGKNLEFYSKDMPTDELRAEMKLLKNGLGVTCEHCHQYKPKRDFSVDVPLKKRARLMLKMADKIQKELFTKEFLGVKEGDAPKATCYMCHKGKEKPDFKPAKADDEAKFNKAIKEDKHKDTVAAMEKLVERINKDHFTWKDAPKATCWMCHRGQLEFSTKAPDGD